jgi:hypothetical protein
MHQPQELARVQVFNRGRLSAAQPPLPVVHQCNAGCVMNRRLCVDNCQVRVAVAAAVQLRLVGGLVAPGGGWLYCACDACGMFASCMPHSMQPAGSMYATQYAAGAPAVQK